MTTKHLLHIGNSQDMSLIDDESVDLIVTSPPYPMIEIWDNVFSMQNEEIRRSIGTVPKRAFELMHKELDKVWRECYRVLRPGAFLCINIGDATRTIGGNFRLYNNHLRITETCNNLGFTELPDIIWRKQTNAPNKFMGSGMLPCGAYVTLEHEWILIFRKGSKREFKSLEERAERMRSSFFWEERNVWFSDIWEIKGTRQKLEKSCSRERSAAFPFEIPYRIINMFSQKGDVVLDPFLGTGTTMKAAIVTGRNSIGYEIDADLEPAIRQNILHMDLDRCNAVIKQRFDNHLKFVADRRAMEKELKHYNKVLNVPVMTAQEEEMTLNYLLSIKPDSSRSCTTEYEAMSDMAFIPNSLFSQMIQQN